MNTLVNLFSCPIKPSLKADIHHIRQSRLMNINNPNFTKVVFVTCVQAVLLLFRHKSLSPTSQSHTVKISRTKRTRINCRRIPDFTGSPVQTHCSPQHRTAYLKHLSSVVEMNGLLRHTSDLNNIKLSEQASFFNCNSCPNIAVSECESY